METINHATPWKKYQTDLTESNLLHEPHQEQAVQLLQSLYEQLCAKNKFNLFTKIIVSQFKKKPQPIKGIYFWGDVGRGKTYLMDIFFQSLPFRNKRRLHFIHLMRYIHQQLDILKGTKEPLEHIVKQLANQVKVLCIDEFFVTDIGDAMLLTKFLQCIFHHQITLIATSNTKPCNLYKNGLQRQNFLPSIFLLEQHTQIYHLKGEIDFRLRELQNMNLYYTKKNAFDLLADNFRKLSKHIPKDLNHGKIIIEGRKINYIAQADDIIWFDLRALCHGPRSHYDYIEIAKLFNTIIISDVPFFEDMDDIARRFVLLIDELYERKTKLIISAEVAIHSLYPVDGKLQFEFQRTISRLIEMQSMDYLQQ